MSGSKGRFGQRTVQYVFVLENLLLACVDITKVLTPYSDRMKTLLKDAKKFYTPKLRPSGHDISASFAKDNGGAIPSNLLQIPNTDSNSDYMSLCKEHGFSTATPLDFQRALPKFFIEFLTNPGDTVADIFSGSNTTGWMAESLNRNWLSIEIDRTYAFASSLLIICEGTGAQVCRHRRHAGWQSLELREHHPCTTSLV